jgi:hypothetical protein
VGDQNANRGKWKSFHQNDVCSHLTP